MNHVRYALNGVVFALWATLAMAAPEWQDYRPDAFAAAQAANDVLLVDVAASWCPTCKAQQPILNELREEEELSGIHFVRVDFDAHKDFLREHQIPRQSTILVFRGRQEVARSIAETDRERLRAFVLDAVRR